MVFHCEPTKIAAGVEEITSLTVYKNQNPLDFTGTTRDTRLIIFLAHQSAATMKLSPLLLLVSAPYTGAMPAPDDPTIAGGMPAMGAAMPAPVAGMPAPEGAAQVGGRGDGFQLEPECVDICPKDREPAMSARCDFAAVGSCLCPTAADVYCAWTCNQEGNQWGIICGGGRLPDPPPESATATADPTTNETVDKDDECADVCPIGSAFGVSCDPAAVGSCPCPHSDEGCSWDCLSAGNGEGTWQMRCGGISGGGMPEPVPSSEPEVSEVFGDPVESPRPEKGEKGVKEEKNDKEAKNNDPEPEQEIPAAIPAPGDASGIVNEGFTLKEECVAACPDKEPSMLLSCDVSDIGSCLCPSPDGACAWTCLGGQWAQICGGNGGPADSAPGNQSNPEVPKEYQARCSGRNPDTNVRMSAPCLACEPCDTSADCALGLQCFPRNTYETKYADVPGCVGAATTDQNYCYDPTSTADLATNDTVDKDDECADVCPIGSAFGVSCDPAAVGSCLCPHRDEGCSWDCLSSGNRGGMWQMRCGGVGGGGIPEPVPSSEPEPETNPDPKPSDCAEACPARFPDLFSPCDSETVGSCECDSRPGCFFKCQEVSGKRSDWVEICYGTIAGSEPEVSQVFERDPVQPVVGNDGCFCPAEVPRPFSSCDLNAVEGCRCPYSDQRLRSASCAFMCLPAGSTGSWFQICGEGGPTQEEGAKPSPSPAPTAHLKGSTAALETSASFAPVPLGSVLAIALVGLVLV